MRYHAEPNRVAPPSPAEYTIAGCTGSDGGGYQEHYCSCASLEAVSRVLRDLGIRHRHADIRHGAKFFSPYGRECDYVAYVVWRV